MSKKREPEVAPGLDPKGPHALDDPGLPPSNHPEDPTEVSDPETTDLGPKAHGPQTEDPEKSPLRKEERKEGEFPVVKGTGGDGFEVEPHDDGSMYVVAPRRLSDDRLRDLEYSGFHPDPREEDGDGRYRMMLPRHLMAQPGKVVMDEEHNGLTVALEDGTGLWVPFNERVPEWRKDWTAGIEVKRINREAERAATPRNAESGWELPAEVASLQARNPGFDPETFEHPKEAKKAP